jgi:hypothetical protein
MTNGLRCRSRMERTGTKFIRDRLLEERLQGGEEEWEAILVSADHYARNKAPKAKTWRKRIGFSTLSEDGRISRAYGWCFELPVPCVLGICWLVGVALIGLAVWAIYLLWSLLLVLA